MGRRRKPQFVASSLDEFAQAPAPQVGQGVRPGPQPLRGPGASTAKRRSGRTMHTHMATRLSHTLSSSGHVHHTPACLPFKRDYVHGEQIQAHAACCMRSPRVVHAWEEPAWREAVGRLRDSVVVQAA